MHYGLGENGLWNKVSCDIVNFLPLLCVYPCQACLNNAGQISTFYVFCSSSKSLKAPTHVRVENYFRLKNHHGSHRLGGPRDYEVIMK